MATTGMDNASTKPYLALAVWMAPLMSAALLYLSFFPVAVGWLAWFALVPWLCLVRIPAPPWMLYLSCWIGAVAFYLPVLQWSRVADLRMYLAWVILTLYCSAFLPASLALLRRLDRRTSLPLTITLPMVWITAEYLRWGIAGGFVASLTGSYQHDYPGGFSWYFLGHTQHDFLEIIQIVDLGGVYAVSLLILLVNALIFEILFMRDWFRCWAIGPQVETRLNRSRVLYHAVAIAGLFLISLAYGVYRLSETTTRPGPKVALIQPNIDQRIRNTAHEEKSESREQARKNIRDQFRELVRAAARHRPDLIVTPETSYPGHWTELTSGLPSRVCRELARRISEDLRTPILLGMNATIGTESGRERSYNSAILIDQNGIWQGRYDKIHRVPIGEYIPLRRAMPFLNYLAPYDYDYAVEPGEDFTRFCLPGDSSASFGVLICYEDTDPAIARPYVADHPVDFLLNLSNDGWFDGTAEHDQHLALCRFRAIETRRTVGRSVNMGISALIDSNGRVLVPELVCEEGRIPVWEISESSASLPRSRWSEFKQVAGVLVGRLPIDSRTSLYAQVGDRLAGGCATLLVAAIVLTHRWRKREAVG